MEEQKVKHVEKVWGSEDWIVNREYCGKVLNLNKGFRCSMHYHKNKDETFYVVKEDKAKKDTLYKARKEAEAKALAEGKATKGKSKKAMKREKREKEGKVKKKVSRRAKVKKVAKKK